MSETRTARYYNSNGVAVAVVARVTSINGELFDWAAYIGGTTRTEREEDCIEDVSQYGCKLYRDDAAHFFPALPIERYRP